MHEKIVKIKSVLQNSKNIVITVHRSPDGDALGSVELVQYTNTIKSQSYCNFSKFLYVIFKLDEW